MTQNTTHKKEQKQPQRRITPAIAFRLLCIALLWMILVWFVVKTRPMDLWTIFVVIASGIVVFVPLYKKYVRNAK
jgi:membrane protein YdbS with pleckstrin-like domain